MSTPKDERVKNRPTRIPVYKRELETFEAEPGFTYRRVVELQGRVERFIAGGWEIVQAGQGDQSDLRVQEATNLSSGVDRRVVNPSGRAASATAVLMRIPTELYEQDQEAKVAELDEFENRIKRHEASNPNQYVDPSSRITR